jgi:hypothetical protein
VYTLAVYYSLIADIQAATESPATPRNDDIAALLNEQASRAIELGNAARWSINHEYIKEADRLLPVPEPPGQSGNEEGAATDRL